MKRTHAKKILDFVDPKKRRRYNFGPTLVTRIVEVLRIAVMGWNFIHVMVPLEDMEKFMDANMVRIRVLVCQV